MDDDDDDEEEDIFGEVHCQNSASRIKIIGPEKRTEKNDINKKDLEKKTVEIVSLYISKGEQEIKKVFTIFSHNKSTF